MGLFVGRNLAIQDQGLVRERGTAKAGGHERWVKTPTP